MSNPLHPPAGTALALAIAILQVLSVLVFFSMECLPCDLFIRRVISITPGCSAVLGLFLITFFFKSIFICTRKGKWVVAYPIKYSQ